MTEPTASLTRTIFRVFLPVRLIHVWLVKVALVAGILWITTGVDSWLGDRAGWLWLAVDVIATFLGIFVLSFPLGPDPTQQSE